MNDLEEHEVAKLKKAEGLIFEVQYAMLRRDDRRTREERTGWWRTLYSMRIELNTFMNQREKK